MINAITFFSFCWSWKENSKWKMKRCQVYSHKNRSLTFLLKSFCIKLWCKKSDVYLCAFTLKQRPINIIENLPNDNRKWREKIFDGKTMCTTTIDILFNLWLYFFFLFFLVQSDDGAMNMYVIQKLWQNCVGIWKILEKNGKKIEKQEKKTPRKW